MKSLRSAVKILLLLCAFPLLTGAASAATVTLSGNILFSALDGSAQDSDGLANGVFTVNGNLVLDGTINCNDDPPLAGNAGACPIRISVSGDLSMRAGSGIFAENRRGGGAGGNIMLTTGGSLFLRGPSGALPGAIVSSSRLTDGVESAGSLTFSVHGDVVLEAGSVISASSLNGSAGAVGITADGTVVAAGLVASGPSRQVLGTKLTGKILDGGKSNQAGGAILIRSHSSAGPGIRVEGNGIIVSQGETPGSQLVLLEACGIEIRGLVASMLKRDGPSQVVLRSGKGLLVDGRDLGSAGPARGRVRADGVEGGSAGFMVDLFAEGDIQVLGPAASSLAAVSSSPGTQAQRSGGAITAISLMGNLSAAGNAFEAGKANTGNQGGIIDLEAKGSATLDGATLRAIGDFATSSPTRKGGSISVRSFQGALSWTFGVGDVRPVGSGTPSSTQGAINLTACSGIDTTGTQFPTVGSALLPFPAENDGVCSPAAPTLPSGEPPLPVCNRPPVADNDAYNVDEGGTLNVAAPGVLDGDTDPDGGSLSAILVSGPTHASSFMLNPDGSFTYVHDGSETTTDSFTYKANDGTSDSNVATVAITINPTNDAPFADNDSYSVNEGATLSVIAPGVLDGDTDAEGSSLTAALVSGPSHASSFTLNADGSFSYTHNGSETASDSFTYKANDGTAYSNVATVTITVNPENDVPFADDDAYSVNECETLNVTAPGVLDGDTDAEGSSLSAALVSGPSHASSFTLNADGSFSYKHDCSETTSDSFTYKANDGTSDSNVATVTITIAAVNDPPAANPDTADITEEAPNVAAANTVSGNVLTNDTDPDSSLTVSAVAGGSVGSPRAGTYGSVTINSDGSFSYTLDDTNPTVNALAPGGTLIDPFGYTASDGALTSSSTLTVTIHGADDPATPDDDAADFIGNTELRVDLEAGSTPAVLATTPSTFGVLDGDVDPEGGAVTISGIVGCDDVSAPFDCVLAGQGTVSLQGNGRFTFVPEPGDTDPTASFQYTLTGNLVPATVTLTRKERVWYVKNDDGGGTGVSNDPFATLAEAQTASVAGDTIYVFEGDGDTTGQDQGIVLKASQRLIGEGVALDVPVSVNGGPNPTVLRDPGNRPAVDNTNAGGHAVSATDAIPGRIDGLSLIGSANAIDITTNGAFGGSGDLSIANNIIDNTVRPGGAEGIDINAGGTGTVTLVVHDNSLTSAGTAIDITRTHGTLIIAALDDNVVSGDTAGSGININSATFDSVPGGALNTVDGGTTVIGVLGNGVGGAGIMLANVQGDLHFSNNLSIFADGGAGLSVSGTGAGVQVRVASASAPAAVGMIEATGGPAVDASAAGLDLRLTSLKSTNSATTGVSLDTVAGTFSAGSGSSITNATGTAFNVNAGTAAISYDGTITNSAGRSVSVTSKPSGSVAFNGTITDTGSGVFLNGNTGSTISFTKQLSMATGANDAFTATGGGTVTATNTASTLITTTGTALNVANTTIGAGGLKFQSITANGGANGIVLDTTGSSGGLTVSGTGSAGSGGTIRNMAGADGAVAGNGIYLRNTKNVSLSWMQLNDFQNFAIRGTNVNGFSLANSTVNGVNGNNDVANEGSISFDELTGSASLINVNVSGGWEDNFRLSNTTGTLNRLALTNCTVGANSASFGNSALNLMASGTAVVNVTVTGGTFTGSRSHHVQFLLNGSGTPNGDLVMTSNTFTQSMAAVAGAGNIFVSSGGSGNPTLTYNIQNNMMRNAIGNSINVSKGAGTGNFSGTIDSNVIGVTGVANSGSSQGNGIAIIHVGGGTHTTHITNNTIRRYNNDGILVQVGDNTSGGSGTVNTTITGNTVKEPDSFALHGLELNIGTTAGDAHFVCASIGGAGALKNDVIGSGVSGNGGFELRARQRQSTTIRLPGYGGAFNDTAAVATFLAGQNTTSGVASISTSAASNGFVNGAACP